MFDAQTTNSPYEISQNILMRKPVCVNIPKKSMFKIHDWTLFPELLSDL